MAKEPEVITIDSDDEAPVPSTSARMTTQTVPADQNSTSNKALAGPIAKSPNQGFFLFCRENKKLINLRYPKMNIEGLKRKYVEMWKGLSDAEKAGYKRRAHLMNQSAIKIVKTKLPTLFDSRHQPRSPVTGFNIFRAEFKKTLPAATNLQDALRKTEEAWNATPKRIQSQYELKASRLSHFGGRSFPFPSQKPLSNIARPSIQPSVKTTTPLPFSGARQILNPAKLSIAPGLTLPSGITVSKVQNEKGKEISFPSRKISQGVTMFVANEPRPQTGNTSSSLALRQQLNTPGRLLAEQRASDPKPSLKAKVQSPIRPRRFFISPQSSIQARPFSTTIGPRLPTPVTSRDNLIQPNLDQHKESFVCRLCGEFGSSRWSFYTKPEMITSIKYVFDLEIDEEKEKKFGISNRVCDGCFAIMTAAEALKRKAVKLQEVTDNFILQHQGAAIQREADDDIIFVSEKKPHSGSELSAQGDSLIQPTPNGLTIHLVGSINPSGPPSNESSEKLDSESQNTPFELPNLDSSNSSVPLPVTKQVTEDSSEKVQNDQPDGFESHSKTDDPEEVNQGSPPTGPARNNLIDESSQMDESLAENHDTFDP